MTLDFQPTSSVPVADTSPPAAYVQKCINSHLARLAKSVAPKPQKHRWRGRKKDRVRAYLHGIVRRSKCVWTWVNPSKIAQALSKDPGQTVSEKTVWRVLRDLAEHEDPKLVVRVCQRRTERNSHFQWLISCREKLLYDREPLFLRWDGKKRHLRLRCRKKDLLGTRTNASGSFLYQQKKRDPTPPGCSAAASGALSSRNNGWKQDVPTVEQLFHTLGLPIYTRGGRIWTHSPWKRMEDRTPSCLIFPDEGRFWDFSTAQGGNAITLARIANPDRQLSFKDALLWLRSKQSPVTAPSPRRFPRQEVPISTFAQMLENRERGGKKAPRPEGLYRLAWQIYREHFRAARMECIKPLAVVGLLVKALAQNAERVAVEDALQMAINRWRQDIPAFTYYCRTNIQQLHQTRWRHPDLRRAGEPEQFAGLLLLARFVNDLRNALDRSVLCSATFSPEVRRNTNVTAISMCLAQISAMFHEDEHVWITDDLRRRGWCKTAKFWCMDISENGVPTGPDGAWLKLNPMSEHGIKNEDVRDFRHVLCEADALSLDEQMKLSERLPFRVVSAVYSGGKSIHYIVEVNTTKESYAKTVKELHDGFPQFDRACKDPARWTRLAGAIRNGILQAAIPVQKFSDLRLATQGTSGNSNV